jgi:hypothetical protein
MEHLAVGRQLDSASDAAAAVDRVSLDCPLFSANAPVSRTDPDVFCPGHVLLHSGRSLVAKAYPISRA